MAMGWALVSPGKHADTLVVPAISRAADMQLVAVCSRDRSRADAFAATHGAQAAYTSLEDLVADPRVEAVFIAVPNFLHAPYVMVAAQAGKHVLVDKPMAVRVDEAVAMVRTCRAHGVKLGVGFHLWNHPGHQEARRLIGNGVLGTITLVRAQWGVGIRGRTEIPLEVFRDARSGPRSAWRVEPGGVGGAWAMMAMGTHCVDLLHFLLGQAIVEVAALTDGQRQDRPLERLATLCVRFSGGTLGTVCCGSRMPDSKNDATLYGSHGRIVLGHTLWTALQGSLEVVSDTVTTTDGLPRPLHSRFRARLRRGSWRHGETGYPNLRRETMGELRVITTTGQETVLEEATVEKLQASLRGPLLRPGDAGYDDARKVWNGMIDRHPALIARCAGAADVIAAVTFARTHSLLVSVRGGGHNVPGTAVCQGGLMIDLAGMRSVRVDPVRRTARAAGGATWGDFDRETQAFGLATTGGVVSDTGIAGLTLGGGLGWLAGKYGLTCDNLLSADVVTAEGQLLTVSATEHADLFWGLRGGGGNFGVVTSFEYQLHPVGPVLAGIVLYPFTKAKEALTVYRDFATAIPDEANTIGALLTSPDGVPVVAIGICYNGDLDAGEQVLRPLREFGPPLADEIRPMAYCQVQTLLDAAFVRGRRYYFKSNFMQHISDGAIDALIERFPTIPSPLSLVYFEQLGKAANRVGATATAFSHRDALCDWGCDAVWLDSVADGVHIEWTRALAEALRPFTMGSDYAPHIGLEAEEGTQRIKAAYGVNYERLVALKNRYDPTNLFRHNQNIPPTV